MRRTCGFRKERNVVDGRPRGGREGNDAWNGEEKERKRRSRRGGRKRVEAKEVPSNHRNGRIGSERSSTRVRTWRSTRHTGRIHRPMDSPIRRTKTTTASIRT